MTMRILLQHRETGLYFKDPEGWTPNPTDATDFISSTKAIDYCAANKISGVQLVLKFEDQDHYFVMQMAADRRAQTEGPRSTT